MSTLINATRSYNALTQNGAMTHSTSLSNCLDMFFLAGASRNISEEDIERIFLSAYTEDRTIALKILFWARDARQGAGEKRFFHIIMKLMQKYYSNEFDAQMIHIPEFGYWKDVFVIEKPNDNNLNWLMYQLEEFPNANLLAKWFPRKGQWFVAMHKYLKLSPKEFRKKLVSMTKVVETQMCNGDWKSVNYEQVPSIAMNKYRSTYLKRDGDRYNEFITAVHAGEKKINASVLYPHQLYQAINKGEDANAVEAQWINLPDYMKDSTERILPVCDVSGSMGEGNGLPMDVSISLGLYISERNKGIFQDAFITFSANPTMNYLKGSMVERMRQLSKAEWGYDTNLIATFDLILDSAIKHNLPETEMPTKILIISDMEFNDACPGTNLDSIKAKYTNSGYVLPDIIFWNVNGRQGNVPAQMHEEGIGLVSGFSPSILQSILKGKVLSPTQLMLLTVDSDRYKSIQSVEQI